MSAEFGLAASAPPIPVGAVAARGRSNDRRFFTGMAIAAALTVFISQFWWGRVSLNGAEARLTSG